MSDQSEISEETRIPLKSAALMIAFVATVFPGGVFWLSSLYSDVVAAKSEIRDLKISVSQVVESEAHRHEEYMNVVHQIDLRLSRMENRGVKPKE